jgi:hypothetical protein
MSELKSQLRRRLLDLGFLILAMVVGLGGFYGWVLIRNHLILDQALLQVIQASQPTEEAAEEVPEP